jgi:hypothetical protein
MTGMSGTFDHDAVRLAVAGMRGAYRRHHAAHVAALSEESVDAAGISAVEFANWACALDERVRKTGEESSTAYMKRRDSDRRGKVLLGLRFIRNRHMHQVVVSNQVVSTQFFDLPSRKEQIARAAAEVGMFSPGIVWQAADRIADPDDGFTSGLAEYEALLKGNTTLFALADAVDWLTREVVARGVQIPDEALPEV